MCCVSAAAAALSCCRSMSQCCVLLCMDCCGGPLISRRLGKQVFATCVRSLNCSQPHRWQIGSKQLDYHIASISWGGWVGGIWGGGLLKHIFLHVVLISQASFRLWLLRS